MTAIMEPPPFTWATKSSMDLIDYGSEFRQPETFRRPKMADAAPASAEAPPPGTTVATAENEGEGSAESSGGCCSCSGGGDDAKPQIIAVAPGENYILKHNRCCTDLHMLLVFFAFWGAMIAVMAHAWEKGDTNLILYGYDWKV